MLGEDCYASQRRLILYSGHAKEDAREDVKDGHGGPEEDRNANQTLRVESVKEWSSRAIWEEAEARTINSYRKRIYLNRLF